jgi:hypothetical protein
VIPPHAALSNSTSPDFVTGFMPPTLPSLKIANLTETLPFFICGALAFSGILKSQFCFILYESVLMYGPKSTPFPSLRISTAQLVIRQWCTKREKTGPARYFSLQSG